MAELIAQGPEPHQRWRRTLRAGEPFTLGREAGLWSTPWDPHISRRHATACWTDGQLRVERLPESRNPIFLAGREAAQISLKAGEHFVIGATTFSVASETVNWSRDRARPVEEQSYSSQYLQRVRFHNADQRIEVLSRLPDVISGAVNESELFIGLVNMLLAGIPRASAVAIVAADERQGPAPVCILHWDRRLASTSEFQPSQRLILEAVRRKDSVLHVWGPGRDATSSQFTLSANVDWAFCTPVLGEACRGWGIYVAGQLAAGASGSADPADLREDLKFTELVGNTLSSLRQAQMMQRRQAALGAFFAPQVLEALGAEDPEIVLKPRETEVSVLFCDLRGFSREAERNAGDLLALLARVSKALGVMTHHILEQGGVFGDFQGDAAMGFWGWPISQPDAIERACLAALAIRVEFEAAARQPNHPLADFRMGIGLATGQAVAGRIGTTDQVKVTVFGPVVNLASRLEGMTKILHAPILLDNVTARAVREQVPPESARCRRIAVVKPYGLTSAVEVSELLPPVKDYPELTDEHIRHYEAALDAFLAGDWSEAVERLHEVPAKDRVKDFLTIFIAQHNRTPPPGWNGVIPLLSKD
ncbi:MAG TPA: adenylate/guanylate cyclase domain-containing protein [Pirellulales bacterium]|nr:adenylate/guanylate cyclase domain-containing protein [Pirellulales bacterium]